MTAHENGRAPVGATADATDAVQGITVTSSEVNTLALLREADENAYSESYVVIEVAGDLGGATCPINYAARWYAGYLGRGDA